MKYVLDSNIALKWVLPEKDSDKAIALRDDYHNGVHELIAPDIFPIEVAHALTRAERQGRLSFSQSRTALTDILRSAPVLHPYLPLLTRATIMSSNLRVGAYDSLYVVLGEREQCEVVTADDRMVKSFQADFPFVVSLTSLP